MAADRIELEAAIRLPRKDVPIVVYDNGEGLVRRAPDRLKALGYTDICQLSGRLQAWKSAGFELFPGRQFLRQGIWRTGGATQAHPLADEVAERSVETICTAIGEILGAFTADECINYFQNSSYA